MTSKYIIICFCLAFLINLSGCEYLGKDRYLHLKVEMSPSLAVKIEQDAKHVVVYIDETEHRSDFKDKKDDYFIALDSYGDTVIKVEFLDSRGDIICSGQTTEYINKTGRTDVNVELNCVEHILYCVDFSSEENRIVRDGETIGGLTLNYNTANSEARVSTSGNKSVLSVDQITIKLPEPSIRVFITGRAVDTEFIALTCEGKQIERIYIEDESYINIGSYNIMANICSIKIESGEACFIEEICYEYYQL